MKNFMRFYALLVMSFVTVSIYGSEFEQNDVQIQIIDSGTPENSYSDFISDSSLADNLTSPAAAAQGQGYAIKPVPGQTRSALAGASAKKGVAIKPVSGQKRAVVAGSSAKKGVAIKPQLPEAMRNLPKRSN